MERESTVRSYILCPPELWMHIFSLHDELNVKFYVLNNDYSTCLNSTTRFCIVPEIRQWSSNQEEY